MLKPRHQGIIIGGTHSGCGKTTITMGLNRALRNRGIDLQPWKAGPDYIDPGFHSLAAGRTCRNLDTMILGDEVVREIYSRQNCELSVVEGVMGLFDGAGGRDERGSAAHLSKLLKLPVILVIDARSMARSAGAIALGYVRFDPGVNVAGFILNRVGSPRHYAMVKEAVEDATGKPVLGAVPRDNTIEMPERHLGLVPVWEKEEEFNKSLDYLAALMEKHIDMTLFMKIAALTEALPEPEHSVFDPALAAAPFVRIAVAKDAAFHFYYEDNLDLLRHCGADVVPFSPLADASLPEGTDAVYIGGGYPELHARTLSGNRSLLEEIRSCCDRGMPLFAECGGFMYLTEGIADEKDRFYRLLSLLPGQTRLGNKVRALGYCEAVFRKDTVLGSKGETARGHVFHWASLEAVPEEAEKALDVRKGEDTIREGFTHKNVLGSWVHLHFASNPSMAATFIASAARYRRNCI